MISKTKKLYNYFHNPQEDREESYLVGVIMPNTKLIPISEKDFNTAGKIRQRGDMVVFSDSGVMTVKDKKKAKDNLKWFQRIVVSNADFSVVMKTHQQLQEILKSERDSRLYSSSVTTESGKTFFTDQSTMSALASYIVNKDTADVHTTWHYSSTNSFEVNMNDMVNAYNLVIQHHAKVRSQYSTMRSDLDSTGIVRDYVEWNPNKKVGDINV